MCSWAFLGLLNVITELQTLLEIKNKKNCNTFYYYFINNESSFDLY